jgi:serine/threonine-protein kinase
LPDIDQQTTHRFGEDTEPVIVAEEIPDYLAGWKRYTLIRRLGSGGMGTVFKAWDPELGRNVALKFLAGGDAETLDRFQREARAQARVDHPAICKVFEVGQVAGRHYIAMQEIHGVTLDDAARELRLEQKVQLVREIAEAVQAAHRLGLIHRDLKPANILVEEADDGSLRPFIVDFGLARDQHSPGAATISGAIAGTMGYMSPEQARGRFEEIDRRTDVYNLGIILYELLGGRPPFEFENLLESLVRLQAEEPPPLRRFNRSIPEDLQTIAMKALERDPARRYDSARALADDLRRFLDGEPIVARPTSVVYRLRTRLRKHRLVAVITAAALLLLAIAGGSLWNERRQAAAREELAQRFGMQIKELELLTRVAHMLPADRAVPIRTVVVPRMERIANEIARSGRIAQGPGSYALARGSITLGDFPRAWSLLEETRRGGYTTPDVHYARGQVLGHFYEEALARAANISEAEVRESAKRDAAQRYRTPALAELRSAAAASIESPDLLVARIAIYEDRFDDAIAAARRASAAAPWLYEAMLLEAVARRSRAHADAEAGRFDAALAGFEEAGRQLDHAVAVAPADLAVRDEECRLQDHILHTVRFKRRITPDDAVRASAPCVEAARVDPTRGRPWKTQGSIHAVVAEDQLRNGEDPSAEIALAVAAMRRAIAIDPTDAGALSGLGRASMTQARWGIPRGVDPRPQLEEAQRMLARAVKAEPRTTAYRLSLANALLSRGEYEHRRGADSRPFLLQAIGQGRAALEADRSVFLVHNLLGNAYNVLADRESAHGGDPRPALAEAAKAFDQAVALNPDNAPVHNNRGNTWLTVAEDLAGRGEPIGDATAKAIASYRRAMELRPDYTLPWFNIGYTMRLAALDRVRHGQDPTAQLAESRAALDRFDAANPGDVDSRVERARGSLLEARALLSRQMDPSPALAAAQRHTHDALAIDSGSAAAMLLDAERARWEAEWLRRAKRPAQATVRRGLEAAARARSADPKNAEALALEAALLTIDGREPGRARARLDEAFRLKPALRRDY